MRALAATLHTIEIALTIPDNEAYTALTTLHRLGLEVVELQRAEIWRFETDAAISGERMLEQVRTLETIYNPNKHALRMRENDRPEPGEAWIEEPGHNVLLASARPIRISGRVLPGVTRAARALAWRLGGRDGAPAPSDIVDRAVRLLFRHSAFQRAVTT
jgi:hypothetical protein